MWLNGRYPKKSRVSTMTQPNFAKPVPFDVSYLKECLEYEPDTGEFVWKVRPYCHFSKASTTNNFNSQFAGKRAGTLVSRAGNNTYRSIGISFNTKTYIILEHRLAWFYMTGEDPDFPIDHINGIKYDNRWSNLRRGDEINLRNKALHKNNTSGVNGVTWRKDSQKWRARLAIDMPDGSTKRITIANTSDFDEAVQALQKAYEEYGYDPNHGKPRNPFA